MPKAASSPFDPALHKTQSMPFLIAQGSEPQQQWRRTLPADEEVAIGRAADPWSVPWDAHISRRHVVVRVEGERLRVRVLPDARNPVFHRGRASMSFAMRGGESFVVGATTFTFEDSRVAIASAGPQPDRTLAFDSHELRHRQFLYSRQRMEVLASLPGTLATVVSEDEWVAQLVSLVLAGVPRAGAAALVVTSPQGTTAGGTDSFRLRHWDYRGPSATRLKFEPRATLIGESLARQATVLQTWRDEGQAEWAYCTPIPGSASRGWTLYVAGVEEGKIEAGEEGDRQWRESLWDDVKFTELVAATAGRLRDTQRLLRGQAALRPFFAPIVLEALGQRDPEEVLAPREIEATVLFCDLRGFSRASEAQARDLTGLLKRVSDALSAMTRRILAEGGVIGDFHGDAAMGFWGWPFPQDDAVERACRAALAIRDEFAQAARISLHPLAGFRVGLGVATGRAVAGKIGSVDQVKVTAFGPVVNRASRLESLTKRIGASILLDDETALRAAAEFSTNEARVRRLFRVRPAGFDSIVALSELRGRRGEGEPKMDESREAAFAEAVVCFERGEWRRASEWLQRAPPEDRVAAFLLDFMADAKFAAPATWSGVLEFH